MLQCGIGAPCSPQEGSDVCEPKIQKEAVVTVSYLKSAQSPMEVTQGASSMQELEL